MIYERGGQRRMHNEEFHYLSSSLYNIKVVQLRRMNRRRHGSIYGKMVNAYNILGKYRFLDKGTDRMITLKTVAVLLSEYPYLPKCKSWVTGCGILGCSAVYFLCGCQRLGRTHCLIFSVEF
jgi:hypothetical protein